MEISKEVRTFVKRVSHVTCDSFEKVLWSRPFFSSKCEIALFTYEIYCVSSPAHHPGQRAKK
jgi:hypothetical protein